jgi:uncharacterized protein involved in exopolysaccharide biosynthesis
MAEGSAVSGEIAQVDASISQASQTLGPNHPALLALKAKRAALEKQFAQERNMASASASAAAAGAAAVSSAIAVEKSKVVGQADKIERLKELHADVELRRDEFNKMTQRAADLRQEATIGDTGLTVLGAAVTPQAPTFPNKPLIFGGALGLGLMSGLLVGLLVELFARRVRGVEDLRSIEPPVLAIVPLAAGTKRSLSRANRPSSRWRWWARPRVVQA